jgi:hypothetical protein
MEQFDLKNACWYRAEMRKRFCAHSELCVGSRAGQPLLKEARNMTETLTMAFRAG